MIIIKKAALPPKPKDFLGSDEDWVKMNTLPEQLNTPQQQPQPAPVQPPKPQQTQIQQEPVAQFEQQEKIRYPKNEPKNRPVLKEQRPPSAPEPDKTIPEWLGNENDWAFVGETPPKGALPIDDKEEDLNLIPSDLGRGRPGMPTDPFDEAMDEEFIKIKPEDAEPVDPASLFDEVLPPDTPMEERNQKFNVREKIYYSLNTGTPLNITYETLPDRMSRTFVSTRTIEPDYVYWAGTNRHILVAWDHLRNGWRAFVVDRIQQAKLEGDQ